METILALLTALGAAVYYAFVQRGKAKAERSRRETAEQKAHMARETIIAMGRADDRASDDDRVQSGASRYDR